MNVKVKCTKCGKTTVFRFVDSLGNSLSLATIWPSIHYYTDDYICNECHEQLPKDREADCSVPIGMF